MTIKSDKQYRHSVSSSFISNVILILYPSIHEVFTGVLGRGKFSLLCHVGGPTAVKDRKLLVEVGFAGNAEMEVSGVRVQFRSYHLKVVWVVLSGTEFQPTDRVSLSYNDFDFFTW